MKKVGEKLNLCGHYVGLGDEKHYIYGAGDVEVHRGYDGRLYVIDFARCAPPEAPPETADRRTVFSRLLVRMLLISFFNFHSSIFNFQFFFF